MTKPSSICPVVVDEMPPVQPYTLETTAQMEPPKFEVGNAYTNASFADAFAQIVSPNTASAESAPPRQENKPKTVRCCGSFRRLRSLLLARLRRSLSTKPRPSNLQSSRRRLLLRLRLRQVHRSVWIGPASHLRKGTFFQKDTLCKVSYSGEDSPVSAAERAVLEGKLSGPLVLQIFVTSWIDSHCGELAEIAEQYRHGRHKKS